MSLVDEARRIGPALEAADAEANDLRRLPISVGILRGLTLIRSRQVTLSGSPPSPTSAPWIRSIRSG
jgi:hypothetical protein